MWFDAFNRRDAAALMGLVDARFEWQTSLTPVQGDTIRGGAGIADFFAQLDETWEELTVTVDDLEAVDDRVVISGRWRGRGCDPRGSARGGWSLTSAGGPDARFPGERDHVGEYPLSRQPSAGARPDDHELTEWIDRDLEGVGASIDSEQPIV